MIDHTGIAVSDFEAAMAFYDRVFEALGASMLFVVPPEHTGGVKVGGYGRDRPVFWLSEGAAQNPTIHVAFAARNRAEVDAFHKAGIKAGGKDNGKPGLRPQYHPDYYGAFIHDPDGNNIEAVCHKPE